MSINQEEEEDNLIEKPTTKKESTKEETIKDMNHPSFQQRERSNQKI